MDPVFQRLTDPAIEVQDAGNGMDISRNLKRARADESFEWSEGHSEILTESSLNSSGVWNGLSSPNGSPPCKKKKKTKGKKRTSNGNKWKCDMCDK